MSISLNPIADIISAVGSVAGDLITTDKERLAAEIEMRKLDQNLDLAQTEVNKAEAANANWFVAGWRPAVGWVGATALAYQFLMYPMLVWGWSLMQAKGWVSTELKPPPMLNTDALWVILSGMLGIAGMRSVEKVKGVAR
jgi:hypothetical protein